MKTRTESIATLAAMLTKGKTPAQLIQLGIDKGLKPDDARSLVNEARKLKGRASLAVAPLNNSTGKESINAATQYLSAFIDGESLEVANRLLLSLNPKLRKLTLTDIAIIAILTESNIKHNNGQSPYKSYTAFAAAHQDIIGTIENRHVRVAIEMLVGFDVFQVTMEAAPKLKRCRTYALTDPDFQAILYPPTPKYE